MMKVFSILMLLFFATCTSNTIEKANAIDVSPIMASPQNQIFDPIKWSFKIEQDGDEATIIATATIEDHWHLYSQFLPEGAMGPVPTTFTYEENGKGNYKTSGKTNESKTVTKYDPNFDMDLTFFDKKAVFKQKIKITTDKDFTLKGGVEFMVCDDQRCLPPDYIEFSFKIKGTSSASTDSEEIEDEVEVDDENIEEVKPNSDENIDSPISFKIPVRQTGDEFTLDFKAFIETGWVMPEGQFLNNPKFSISFQPAEGVNFDSELVNKNQTDTIDWFGNTILGYTNSASFQKVITVSDTANLPVIKGSINFVSVNQFDSLLVKNSVPVNFEVDLTTAQKIEDVESDKSYWGIFIAAFLSGFLALLTPCVFPMIPMTVSFFTKQSKTRALGIRNAIIYGLSIVIIYVLLGLLITVLFGSDALNALSTNIWFNIGFFVLFVIFAISFFGAFEIKLPASWINKADKQADRGGFIGIFFMAFTLALVSFSCTGPIIGTLLVEASQTGVSGPLVGMLGFSLALALPFALFAAFPGWLNSLPQSGGWLNSVKVVLGFIELALAFKFLSNADLVAQTHLLEREVFIAAWIAIFALMGFYLLGKLKFSHDSDLPYISVPRLMMSILTFSFVIYLLPGMWGAPLKWLSGFPPPITYSESPYGIGGQPPVVADSLPPSAHVMPNGITTIHDYDEGLAYAKSVNKPIMIDFTGYACVNCRKMEEHVWPEDHVLPLLKDDYVIVSLYVDDKAMLPEDEQYVSSTTGKKIRTIGNKWSDFQIKRYKSNSQPQYVVIDHQENRLIEFASYESHSNPANYEDWLKSGIKAFNIVADTKTITPEVVKVAIK